MILMMKNINDYLLSKYHKKFFVFFVFCFFWFFVLCFLVFYFSILQCFDDESVHRLSGIGFLSQVKDVFRWWGRNLIWELHELFYSRLKILEGSWLGGEFLDTVHLCEKRDLTRSYRPLQDVLGDEFFG